MGHFTVRMTNAARRWWSMTDALLCLRSRGTFLTQRAKNTTAGAKQVHFLRGREVTLDADASQGIIYYLYQGKQGMSMFSSTMMHFELLRAICVVSL